MMRKWFQHRLHKLNSEQNGGNLQKGPCCPKRSCHVPGGEGWAQPQLLICFLLKQRSRAGRTSQFLGEAKSTCTKQQPSRPQESHAALTARSFFAPLFSPADVHGRVTFPTSLAPAPPLFHAPAREDWARFSFAERRTTFAGRRKQVLLTVSASSPSSAASNQGRVLWAGSTGSCPQCRLSFGHCSVGASHSTARRVNSSYPHARQVVHTPVGTCQCRHAYLRTYPALLTPPCIWGVVFTYWFHPHILHRILIPDFC